MHGYYCRTRWAMISRTVECQLWRVRKKRLVKEMKRSLFVTIWQFFNCVAPMYKCIVMVISLSMSEHRQ